MPPIKMVDLFLQCCLGMEFLNTNVSGDMAQLLQHNQEKYVPITVNRDSTFTVLACILLHRNQLHVFHVVMSSAHSGIVWIQLKELID